jgi:transposase
MSEKELRRVEVFGQVASGSLRLLDAAEILWLSYRQSKRLWKQFRQGGPESLQHGNAGRPSHRGKPEAFRQQVLQLVRAKYSGTLQERFGPTLAAEHLAEEDGLWIDSETLRRWMLEAGLWSRTRGCQRTHRKRRPCREHFGELVQLDGSFHAWLEARGPQGCLMNMVDDATSKTQSFLGRQETIWAAARVLRLWIETYGVPVALYTDWKNVYVVAPTEKQQLRGETPLTQFGRMCARLGIRIIAASSPQAKGRVERKNGVHQDRLVKKLRRKNIATAAAANAYLQQEYLPALNQRFAKPAARPEDYHRAKPSAQELDAIFRLEEQRAVSQDWVLRYQGRFLQLLPSPHGVTPRSKVLVYESEDGALEVRYRGATLPWEEIPAPIAEATPVAQTGHVPYSRTRCKPGPDHPYKRRSEQSVRERRRKMLQQAVAARRAGAASATPAGSAPAAPAAQTLQPPTGDILIELKQGTF